MMRMVFALAALCMLIAAPAWSVDRDGDGVADGLAPQSPSAALDVGDIAVVDTGDFAVSVYVDRLTGLGYTVTTIPPDSDYATLIGYGLVILPVGHGNEGNYWTFDALASDYLDYVSMGGGLWVGQPNPFGMPDNTATITWVPYSLTLNNGYDDQDCPPVIVDPNHCITEGLPNTQFSFPGDIVMEMGPEWQVLTEGPVTGYPSVLVATYAGGKILVELGHPYTGAICPPDDAALDRYVICTMGGIVGTETSSWSTVKTMFR